MKIVIIGDLHAQKEGLRTPILVGFLDYVEKFYFETGCERIFVVGDIFQKSSNIKNEAFIPLFLKFNEMKEKGIKFDFIMGNHDIFNADNDSIVETFITLGNVYKKGTEVEIDNKQFYFLPYTKKEEDIPPGGQFLITHLSIADFSFDNAYHATEKHAFSRSLFENWQQVFTGHFHRHQSWKNICYVGSPLQMNKGEIGQSKGFVLLDTELEQWEFVEYEGAPTFLKITEEELVNLPNLSFENKIVIFNLKTRIKDYAKLRYIAFEKGAVDIIPEFERDEESLLQTKGEINSESSTEDIVKQILMETKPEDLEWKRIEKIFDKIVSEG